MTASMFVIVHRRDTGREVTEQVWGVFPETDRDQAVEHAAELQHDANHRYGRPRDTYRVARGRPFWTRRTDMNISVTGYSPQTLTLPNGDTIGMYTLVDGSYWSATGEFDLTGQVIGWGPDGIAIAYENSSVTCDPDRVRLAAEVAR